MYEDINFEELRSDLINYYGTAATSGMFEAYMYVDIVKNASFSKLIELAKSNGFNLNDYKKGYSKTYRM